jgi:hypothetical protein
MLFGGAGFASDNLDHIIAIALLVICAIYLYIAMGTIHKGKTGPRVPKTPALTPEQWIL